jgi:hypothetical protein
LRRKPPTNSPRGIPGKALSLKPKGEDMYNIDNSLLQYGEAIEPPIAFVCEKIGCRNIVRIGQLCYKNRICEDCAPKEAHLERAERREA